jgi:hypothetical protein
MTSSYEPECPGSETLAELVGEGDDQRPRKGRFRRLSDVAAEAWQSDRWKSDDCANYCLACEVRWKGKVTEHPAKPCTGPSIMSVHLTDPDGEWLFPSLQKPVPQEWDYQCQHCEWKWGGGPTEHPQNGCTRPDSWTDDEIDAAMRQLFEDAKWSVVHRNWHDGDHDYYEEWDKWMEHRERPDFIYDYPDGAAHKRPGLDYFPVRMEGGKVMYSRVNDESIYDEDGKAWEDDGFLDAETYLGLVPDQIPWIIKDFAYEGGITLVTGAPKAGKSTLISQLVRACETGEQFLDRDVPPNVPVLLVTEESGVPVKWKFAGLRRLTIYDRGMAGEESFVATINKIIRWVQRNPKGIVVIDTLSIWGGVEDENDAAKVTKVLAQVKTLATWGCATILVHHSRKGGGKDGEGVRGSGAFLATVDHLVEVTRVSESNLTQRYISLMGRVVMPSRMLVDFNIVGRFYHLADSEAPGLAEIEADLIGIPPVGTGPGVDRNAISRLWKRTPKKRIEQLVNIGRLKEEWYVSGSVHKWVYWSIPAATGTAGKSLDTQWNQ